MVENDSIPPSWAKVVKVTRPGFSKRENTYAIHPLFPDITWGLFGNLIEQNRPYEPIITILGEQLASFYPLEFTQGDYPHQPHRDFLYPNTPPWNLPVNEVLEYLAFFPPEDTYPILRHYLFHPSVDIRWYSTISILMNANKGVYPQKVENEFMEILNSDPDNLLKSWRNNYAQYESEQPDIRWSRTLKSSIFERPVLINIYDLNEIRMYFGLDKNHPFSPRSLASDLDIQNNINKLNRIICLLQSKNNHGPIGENGPLPDQYKNPPKPLQQMPKIEEMIPYLVKLKDQEKALAIVNMLARPDSFLVTNNISNWDIEQVLKLAIKYITIIDNQKMHLPLIRLAYDLISNQYTFLNQSELISTALSISYLLPLGQIQDQILPIAKRYNHLLKESCIFFRSLLPAIARDMTQINVPRYGTKKLD